MSYRYRTFQHGRRGGNSQQTSSRSDTAVLPKPEASQTRIEYVTSSPMLSGDYSTKTRIENVEYVASFSWTDTRDPTILVPGKPPRWQPHTVARTLREDDGNGVYHRDPNSARFPTFPVEPAIRAIRETTPNFDISEIDVFGCGNTLGSLLSFVRGEERTFRFGAEYIGSSLFLVRKTNRPGELIEDVRGYGHTFPEAYTQWDKSVKTSVSYQRIIKYDFAGLKCFVRSESDGYLPALAGGLEETSQDSGNVQGDTADVDRLLGLALGVQRPSTGKRVSVQRAGAVVPQRALFDLKTRSLKKMQQGVSIEDFLHRLWVNQTPNMILAYHTHGSFAPSDIHVIDARSRVAQWEGNNSTTLSKLGGLLHKLVELAKQNSRRCLEVRRSGTGPLEIWSEAPHWSALPVDLKQVLGVGGLQENVQTHSPAAMGETQSSEDEDDDLLKF